MVKRDRDAFVPVTNGIPRDRAVVALQQYMIERSRRHRPTRPGRTSLSGGALEVPTQSNNYRLGGSLNVRGHTAL